MSDKTELSAKHEAVMRKAAAAVRARGHEGDARLADSLLGIVALLQQPARRATIQPTAAPFGYAVEQPDGHVTFFKDDPKGFRAYPNCSPDKSWAELGVKVHDLYSELTQCPRCNNPHHGIPALVA